MNKPRILDDSLARVNREIDTLLNTVDKAVYDHRLTGFNFIGKGVRSRFTLLLGDALGLERGPVERVSVAAELVHTASLIHDDCIDKASLRRGQPTLNDRLGVNSAILVGDLVVSLALDYAERITPEMPGKLVRVVRRMTEGALLEENLRYTNISAAQAEHILALKTGELFRWCGLTAAGLARRPELFETCSDIGVETGVIFQIIDDILDFEGESGLTGKDALKDITDGRITLPVILALSDPHHSGAIEVELTALKTGGNGRQEPALRIAELIKTNGFTASARAIAAAKMRALEKMIALLPEREAAGHFRDYIFALAERAK